MIGFIVRAWLVLTMTGGYRFLALGFALGLAAGAAIFG